jgi:hypothetical protein
MTTALCIIFGFTVGNFLWASLQDKDAKNCNRWEQAFKLSFHQAVAIAITAYYFSQ